MSIRSRLERLERWQPGRVTIWQVFDGEKDAADLDDADKALLQQALDVDIARDVIEERIAAVGRPLPSTGSPGPPATKKEDNQD
jgi:hypothetical protein